MVLLTRLQIKWGYFIFDNYLFILFLESESQREQAGVVRQGECEWDKQTPH